MLVMINRQDSLQTISYKFPIGLHNLPGTVHARYVETKFERAYTSRYERSRLAGEKFRKEQQKRIKINMMTHTPSSDPEHIFEL